MTESERKIDRKANTATVEDTPKPESEQTDGGHDLRPDLEHFSGFDRDGVMNILRRLPRPGVSVVGVAMGVMYGLVFAGALSVGYGATSLAAAYGGVYVALMVGGAFAFGYGYLGIQIVDAVTREPDIIEP